MRVHQLLYALRNADSDAEVWIAVLGDDGEEEAQLPVTAAEVFGDRFMVAAGGDDD